MTVATSQELSAEKGAELIHRETGRSCSRQNLEKLCRKGALKESPCVLSAYPLRVDADLLVAEYQAKVAPYQIEAQQPAAKVKTAASVAPAHRPVSAPSEDPGGDHPGEVPNYNEERAWHEREKRLIAELDRRQKAGELVYKADVEQAQMAIALTLKNQLEALPKQIKQQLPHLSISDEEMIERLVAKVLTAVADWRIDQEEEE
jgi:hypothetical protein